MGPETLIVCAKCAEPQPPTEYRFRDKAAQQRDRTCRTCRKASQALWREQNRERVREQNREWYRANRKKASERRKARVSEMSDEELAEHKARQDAARERMAERRIAEYLAEHGAPPLCACGCGEQVRFGDNGRPRMYRANHQPSDTSYIFAALEAKGERIPIDKFRAVVMRLKAEKGWTVKETAERAGISVDHLNSVLYDRSRYKAFGLDREWVTNVLRRMSGMAAPMSAYQRRRMAEDAKRWDETDPDRFV